MSVEKRKIYQIEIPVLFVDCDQGGQWKPASAFHFLSEAAGGHADELGWGYYDLLEKKLFWVLSRFKVRFHRYPQYGETIQLSTWPQGVTQKVFFVRDYEARDRSGALLLSASSLWLLIDSESRRMAPLNRLDSDDLKIAIPPERKVDLEKLNLSATGSQMSTHQVSYSDIDMLGHANNSRYIEWICDSFGPECFQDQEVETLQINFERELRIGQRIAIHHAKPDQSNSTYIEGFEISRNTRAFEAELSWRPRGGGDKKTVEEGTETGN